jgi:deazaflavin-dependent oxidoreductase (nitroreductase family)
MTIWNKTSWDERNCDVITEFRENQGQTGGRELVLLTTTGWRSGEQHTTPLMYLAEGDRIYVIASKGGAPSHPDWYHNAVAGPTVTLEVGAELYQAIATVLTTEERARVFDKQARRHPFFAEYAKTTPCEIPVVMFERGT